MSKYSEQDLEYAAQFREEIHKEALAKVRKIYPDITDVIDSCPVEDYLRENWEYPGKWYTIVAIPKNFKSRGELIDTIARNTEAHYAENPVPQNPTEHSDYTQAQKSRDKNKIINDKAFDRLISEYPDLAVDYCIVMNEHTSEGVNAHKTALARACGELFVDENGETIWHYNVGRADAERIGTEELFSPRCPNSGVNYRKAFLYPPYENGYTGEDFIRINSSLFPDGTDKLEVYKWTTDWSEYFDEGREWWGTLCLTVYDKSLDRFVVILASATD